jgi:hypothetical protein
MGDERKAVGFCSTGGFAVFGPFCVTKIDLRSGVIVLLNHFFGSLG